MGRNAGYKGRTGLYELIVIDETLRRMIHEGASEAMLLAHARTSSPAMLEDGWNKVIAGITSADEVLRVTRDE
jgi:general secretion pathway protein E